MTYVNPAIKKVGPGKVLSAFGVKLFDRFLCLPGDLLSHDGAAAIIGGLGLEITPDELSEEYIPGGSFLLKDIKYSLRRVGDKYQMTCTETVTNGVMTPRAFQVIKPLTQF